MSDRPSAEVGGKIRMAGDDDEGTERECNENGPEEAARNGLLGVHDRFVGDTKMNGGVRARLYCLGACCLLLAVAVIVLASMWPRNHHGNACLEPECLRLAAENLQRMDQSASVCADPRQWSCGGWLADNARQLPARAHWSPQEAVKLEELRKLRDIITTMAVAQGTDTLEWRLKTLYESCMAVNIIEQNGNYPLDRIIKELGGWHVRQDWHKTSHSWSWRQALEKLQSHFGITPFFAATLAWRGNATALHLEPSGLGLPHPALYREPSDSQTVKAYKTLLKDVALSLGAMNQLATRFADDIFSFEQRLAIRILEYDEEGPESWRTLQSLSDAAMQPFRSILRAMFPKIPLTDKMELLVTYPGYIEYILTVATTTTPGALNDYFTWTLIRKYLPYMSKNFRIIWREFQSQLTGSVEDVSRWEFCARLVQETAPLGTLALLESNREKVFSRLNSTEEASRREGVQYIFEAIKTKAIDVVKSSTHVDGHTKSLMFEQVNGLQLQIGLKAHEKSEEFLQNYHNGFAVQTDELFQNIRFSLEFEMDLMQNAFLNKDLSVVRDNAKKLILTEASYNQHVQTVILPSPLTTLPYFDTEHPSFVQYARVGVTLGTAVASALAVIEPNATTTLPAYATPTIDCLMNTLMETTKVNFTLPTNVAASVYIRIIGATLALEAARETTSKRNLLPLLEQYSQEELFALTYGQALCSMRTHEQMLLDHINSAVVGETMFQLTWPQIVGVQQALQCSTTECPTPF